MVIFANVIPYIIIMFIVVIVMVNIIFYDYRDGQLCFLPLQPSLTSINSILIVTSIDKL